MYVQKFIAEKIGKISNAKVEKLDGVTVITPDEAPTPKKKEIKTVQTPTKAVQSNQNTPKPNSKSSMFFNKAKKELLAMADDDAWRIFVDEMVRPSFKKGDGTQLHRCYISSEYKFIADAIFSVPNSVVINAMLRAFVASHKKELSSLLKSMNPLLNGKIS